MHTNNAYILVYNDLHMNAISTPNKTLFLSYSRRQATWCDDLYTAIDTYTPFYRWRDNKIPESADWWDSICLNIEGCYAFVAILTKDYLDSVYCMGELEYALKLKKPIIALMLQDVPYPQKLDEQRLQFARVENLDMPQVITKVLNACYQITLSYIQGDYSPEIHPRSHLRPPVPRPKARKVILEEDTIIARQVDTVTIHGLPIPTYDLIRRYQEEKHRNIRLARELLDKIRQRHDRETSFNIAKEDKELQLAEKQFDQQEEERLHTKRISVEYEKLVHFVTTLSPDKARQAIQHFTEKYPGYGDPQGLAKKFNSASHLRMPAPFDWIEIPNKGYSIAKYPITNAQFAKFIEAGGYKEPKWWTPDGWTKCQEGWHFANGWKPSGKAWTQPRYWDDSQWIGPEHPVVGVSWYEAIAFCLWLSDVSGEKIMLPTESQWQYAAQGDNKREFPWGNEWDPNRCNNNVDQKGIGRTTPVRQYEGKGDSPFGVVDMVGNVWEWCLTDYAAEANDMNSNVTYRVLRGGSWSNYLTSMFHCAARGRNNPYGRSEFRGFRIARG
jgi:formylglycine-generating enzyme required for sulfatase activity